VPVGDQNEVQGRKVLKRDSGWPVPFEDVQAFQVEWVREEIAPIETDEDRGMADKDRGILSPGKTKGASGKIGSPRLYA